MEERSILDLLSHFVSDDQDEQDAQGKTKSDEQNNLLITSLKALINKSGSAIDIDEFLSGKGTLLETTRAALVSNSSAATEEIATILIKQFDIPPGIAKTLAGILISLLPSVETETTETKKPRKKTKPKTTASTTTASSSTKKTAKKKETTKPKTTTSKPAAKKKPTSQSSTSKPSTSKTSTSKSSKKTTTSTAKPKRTTRTTTLEDVMDE